MNLADEVRDHLLSDIEVADDAVPQRPYGDDARRGATDHALGLGPDSQDALGLGLHRDDAGLADDDASVADVDQGVGCAEVDPDIAREQT